MVRAHRVASPMNILASRRVFWTFAFVMVAMLLVLLQRVAVAGQRNGSPPLVLQGNQGSQSSTLELPTAPTHQGGELNIPPQAPAPQVPEQQELTIPSRQLRQQPGYAQVTVTVTDSSGGYVTGLQKDDFKLYLDGQQRPIEFFRQDLNTPVSIGLLVDTSGSMSSKLPQARVAILDFINELNPRDDVFLFAFSSRPYLLQGFTTNHSLIISKLRLLFASGQTALFDVIEAGLQMVRSGRYDKKALLVVTDGMDNMSRTNVDGIVMAARRQGVLVYSIGIGDPNAPEPSGITIGPFAIPMLGSQDRVDSQTLHTLSAETGARTYIIQRIGDGAALRTACQQISRELREQYTLGFVAPDPGAHGYRSVRVDTPTHPGETVRVRKGVEVGGPAAYAAEPGTPIP
jgi:Ca-activated chloride channel family protein